MNRTELEAIIAEKEKLPRTQVTAILSAALEEISISLGRGEDVKLVNFGCFSMTESRAKPGRNPRTGETMEIPPRRKVRFRPGRALAAVIGTPS
jgi:DNA-binding protein HU-beta